MADTDRDPRVTERYRGLAGEQPPARLDAAVLAAARDALEKVRPAPLVAPTQRRHWYVPLAAAAVIMLSVAVTLQWQRAQPDAESLPAEAERPAPQAPAAVPAPQTATPGVAGTEGERATPRIAARPAAQALPTRKEKTSLDGATGPAPEPAARSVESAAPPPASRADRGSAAPPASSPPGASAADRSQAQAERSPQAWLERIARLRREGRNAEADEAYAEFRRRHPDFRIPDARRDQVLPR